VATKIQCDAKTCVHRFEDGTCENQFIKIDENGYCEDLETQEDIE